MAKNTSARIHRDESGQSIFLEFLIVIPIFLLLITAAIQLGFYIYASNAVSNAASATAQEVAATGQVHIGPLDVVANSALQRAALPPGAAVSASLPGGSCAPLSGGNYQTEQGTVTVTYNWQAPILPFPVLPVNNRITKTAVIPILTEYGSCG